MVRSRGVRASSPSTTPRSSDIEWLREGWGEDQTPDTGRETEAIFVTRRESVQLAVRLLEQGRNPIANDV